MLIWTYLNVLGILGTHNVKLVSNILIKEIPTNKGANSCKPLKIGTSQSFNQDSFKWKILFLHFHRIILDFDHS